MLDRQMINERKVGIQAINGLSSGEVRGWGENRVMDGLTKTKNT